MSLIDRITRRPGRMGLVMYARILGACVKEAKKAVDVAADLGRARQSVHEILWRLESLGVAHVEDWVKPEHQNGMMSPLFRAFPGKSEPYPRELQRPPFGRAGGTRSEIISFASALKAMSEGATRAEVLEMTGMSWCNFAKLLRELRKQRLVHVCSWEPRSDERSADVEVLKFGPGKDAPRPKPLTPSERYRRYRLRKSAKLAGQRIVHATAGSVPIEARGIQPAYSGLAIGRSLD